MISSLPVRYIDWLSKFSMQLYINLDALKVEMITDN